MSYLSIFDQQYDAAIYGCGYAGLAAAWSLTAAGKKVLLFDRRMDVGWESGRSFAWQTGEISHESWHHFLAELQTRNLYNDGIIDSAGAEVVIATKLREQRQQLHTLLNAWPVQALMANDQIQSISVATKSGLRTLKADCWIDASDEATLFRIAFPQQAFRAPAAWEHRALFFSKASDAKIPSSRISESVTVESRLWKNEFTVCARAKTVYSSPELLALMTDVRTALPAPLHQSAITAFSVYPMPIYEADSARNETQLGNLFSASPALDDRDIVALGERFQLGVEAANSAQKSTFNIAPGDTLKTLPSRQETCDVFIAGAGTSGALAAITAQREGVKVLLSDTTTFSGGVGTGGQIAGYFHGQSGGLFEELDSQSQQIGKVLSGGKPTRSHETKKIAFERTFTGDFLAETMTFGVSVQDKKIVSLQLISPHGIIEVTSKTIIDCTGDGDVAALANADFDFGRQEDGFPLAYSQSCLHVKGSNVRSTNFDAGWCDPTDPEDLTRARLVAISQHLRERFSDDLHLLLFAPTLGLRQSRQIKTEAQLSLNDIISHTSREFSIGQINSPLDTHSIDYEFEDDETLFWLWACKSFRESTFAEMPYGIMIPKGFSNLWIACRASGITPPAAYAARMQRDMQRIGEAAGYAAVLSVKSDRDAMNISQNILQEKLRQSGALTQLQHIKGTRKDILAQLDSAIPGGYLWEIYQHRDCFESAILERLESANTDISWLAAIVLAMWGDHRAEPRFIRAIENTEVGVETPPMARGSYNQWIDVPNWFLAINLLRRCGSAACLPALHQVASRSRNILHLRTSIALTIARLADQLDESDKLVAGNILKVLLHDAIPDTFVRPSRSIYRALRGEEQLPLSQEPQGLDTREDHSWRVDFAIAKAARALGIASPANIDHWLNDERALVRAAFLEKR